MTGQGNASAQVGGYGAGSGEYGFIYAGGGSAKGNIFDQFGMVKFAKGGIVTGPTVFPFARGTGLMGEAGPEAIMPLSRGRGGVLGVRTDGGGGGAGTTNVIVHNYSGQQVQTRESNSGGMDKRTIEVMIGNAISSGGPASKAFEATYGLRRSGR
jgi:phage-related minor tail protein